MAKLFDAKLDNYELRILDISDTIGQSIARQEFINEDGAILQNMGLHAREIKFRCFFFGSDVGGFTANYSNHLSFLNGLNDTSKTHVLIHPKYGTMQGMIESTTLIHDDTQNYVAIDITFIQQGLQNQKAQLSTTGFLQVAAQQALVGVNSNISTAIPGLLTSSGLSSVLGKVVSAEKSLTSQIQGVSSAVRGFLKEADTVIGVLDTTLADVNTISSTLNSAVSYVGDVPSRIVGSIVNCSDRIMGSLSNLSNLPVNFINSAIYNMNALKDSVTGKHADFFKSRMTSIWSGTLGKQATVLFKADDQADAQWKSLEQNQSFDLNGRRVTASVATPPMTVQDIEGIAYSVRQYIQGAIDLDRDQPTLKAMAEALISYVGQAKLKKQVQMPVSISPSMPLHIICAKFGLTYNTVDRLLKINPSILNPTFASGTVQVYAQQP